MTGALLLGLSLLLALASAALAWSHARRVLGVTRGDLAALASALKRVPAADRVRALLERTESGSWEHALAAEVLAAPDEEARVAAVNLALAEVEHTLRRGATWPPAALRIALLGAVLLAVCAYLADRESLRWPLAILGAGAVAALSCVEAGRSGERHAERQRLAIDALVGVALALPEGRTVPDSGTAPRRTERRARRRGGPS